jgi:hypothetical protein
MATAAAVVGRAFTLDIVGAIVAEQNDMVGAIDELWRRGIVREHGSTVTTSATTRSARSPT